MSIFSSILSKIFPSMFAKSEAASRPAPSEVDVVSILSEKAKHVPEKLNWKTSIVDLMKLLGLDSSLTSRQQLAKELQYSGNISDSASMNVWLQKQVMKKLAENGGQVPAELMN